MSRLKKLAKKLALSFAFFGLVMAVCELVARGFEPGPFSFLDSNPYMPGELVRHVHKPDFEGRWDSTWYQTNSRGMRGAELQVGFDEDEYRVVCVGDSCTFGKGVAEGDCWPRQLEGLLAEHVASAGGAWHPVVANLGVNGFSGRDYMRLFKGEGVELQPDLVLIGYNLNDFPNSIRAVDDLIYAKQGLRRILGTELRDFLGRFALYRFCRATYYDMNQKRDWKNAESIAARAATDDMDSEVWLKQREYLQGIIADASQSGAHVAVFLFPYESQVYLDSYQTAPIDRLRELCAEIGVPFVDLAAEFRERVRGANPPEQLFLRGDRYHPSPEGYGIVAEAVLQLVVNEKWLPGS